MARITTRTARMGTCGTLDVRAPHTSTNVLRGPALLLICIKRSTNDIMIWLADAVLGARADCALYRRRARHDLGGRGAGLEVGA